MTRRHRKRSRHRYMGTRSWGGGNVKKRRGAGSRGGRGMGGSKKQKWTYVVRYMPGHFGRHGFHSIHKQHVDAINVGDINDRIESGKLAQEGGKYVFDFRGKVLAGGGISHPATVRADSFSKAAEEKIRKAGGEAVVKGRKAEAAKAA